MPPRSRHVETPPASRWASGRYPATARAVIALRFDDGQAIDYTTTFPALTSRGLVAGFAISSNNIGGSYITWPQLLEMQKAGMEILCHSKSHGADPTTFASFMTEIGESVGKLRQMGLDIAGFVTPGTWVTSNAYRCDGSGWYGTPQDKALRQLYRSFEAYNLGLYDQNFRFNLPFDSTKRMQGWSHPTYSDATYNLATMKGHIDSAITEGRCYEFLCHAWDLDGVGKTTWADFLALLDYIQIQKNLGRVVVVTPTQLAHAYGPTPAPWLFESDFETNDTTQWTTNSDATHLTVTAGAALASTNKGLAVNVTSTTAFYLAKTGYNSTTGKLRFRFYIDPNTLTMATNDSFGFIRMYDSGYNVAAGCILKFNGSTYQLFLEYGTDAATNTGTARNITDAPHYVEIYITRSSSSVASDGTMTMWIDGTQYDALTGQDNYDRFLQFANMRIGGVTGLDAGTSGTFYLDEIVVNETGTQIGA